MYEAAAPVMVRPSKVMLRAGAACVPRTSKSVASSGASKVQPAGGGVPCEALWKYQRRWLAASK